MKPLFETQRLLVYKTSIDRAAEGAFDLYLAYERAMNDHPYCQVVECSTATDSNCVLWVETRGRPRQGFALELLNGIADHQQFVNPLYPNSTIKALADELFDKHEAWFQSQRV